MNSSNNSSQNKVKNKFNALKSIYALRNIFKQLQRKKTLEIVKYNKTLQNKIKIDLNDYIDYAGKYSTVEIEIIPAKGKYGKFINIREKNSYYHIFFNYGKKERKLNYIKRNELIIKIRIIIDYQVYSFYKLFQDCECIKSITFKKYFRNNIKYMNYMFSGCASLEKINFSGFNFYGFNGMSYMFSGCSSLKELNLSNFNTSQVTDMTSLFFGCSSLKSLDLSNFITDQVTDMKYMFSECLSLEILNISNFKTNNVVNMSHLCSKCLLLKEIYIPDFKTDLVNDISFMFYECSNELKNKMKATNNNFTEEAFS